MNSASSHKTSKVFGLFRCHARRAWLLHGYMIATLILFPVWPQMLRAEEDPPPEETWSDPVPQSLLMAQLSSPQAEIFTENDTSKQLDVLVERHSWQVSTSSLGNTWITDYAVEVVSQANVDFSITSPNANGVGSIFSASANTDSSGRGSAVIPLDGAPIVVVQASVLTTSYESTTSSYTFTLEAPVEEWSFSHSEALLQATFSAEGDSVLAVGEQRTCTLTATYESWDVYTSNFGNTETRNYASTPAAGASVYWALYSADGAISSPSGEQLESDGTGTIEFIMGSTDATVQAELSYLSTTTATATKSFTPAAVTETWTMDRTEGYISTTLDDTSSSISLAAGTSRVIDATVTLTTWEIWNSSLGNTETRNYSSGPAIGTPVHFHIPFGDGSWSNSGPGSAFNTSASTDGNGRASVTFYMGTSDSEISALAYYNSAQSSDSMTLTWDSGGGGGGSETWTFQGLYQELLVNAVAANTTAASVPVNATVSYRTWEVWSNQYGNTENRNVSTSAAINAPVSAFVTTGNGSIATTTPSTDIAGGFNLTYNAASQPAMITVGASFTTANGTVYGSNSVVISNLDSDGDGYSDADEVSTGTNPNDPNSNQGQTPPPDPTYQFSTVTIGPNVWQRGVISTQKLQLDGYTITYTESESETTTHEFSAGLQFGLTETSGSAAWKGALGWTTQHIISVTKSYTWVTVSSPAPKFWGLHTLLDPNPADPEFYTQQKILENVPADWEYVSHEMPLNESLPPVPDQTETIDSETKEIKSTQASRWKIIIHIRRRTN